MAEIIQAKDLRAKERTLAADIPLPAPYALYIEPTSACNMRCQFCPTGHKELRELRPNGLMPFATWAKLVDDLRAWGVVLKRANLYKDGEPLIHPQFAEMVRYMKDAGVTDSIWTKTNGLALKPELNEKLAGCGLDMLGISVQQVSAEGYLRIAGVRMDYEKFKANIADLYRRRTFQLYIKIADSGLTDAERQKFQDDFSPIADYVSIEGLHGWSNSDVKDFTMGTNPATFEGYPPTEKIACPLPFYLLAVNWNGTVSLCNEDWQHQTLVGDIRRESLRDIWHGERLRSMRRMHLEGRRGENVMCRSCHYLTTLPDNLDGVRTDLLRRIG